MTLMMVWLPPFIFNIFDRLFATYYAVEWGVQM